MCHVAILMQGADAHRNGDSAAAAAAARQQLLPLGCHSTSDCLSKNELGVERSPLLREGDLHRRPHPVIPQPPHMPSTYHHIHRLYQNHNKRCLPCRATGQSTGQCTTGTSGPPWTYLAQQHPAAAATRGMPMHQPPSSPRPPLHPAAKTIRAHTLLAQ
jgi:hypothetical protein